jgi:hypothetical protein
MNSIELLESRVAPATLVNPTTVTYTDVDFDIVTVKISKGTFTDPNVSTDDFTFTGIPAFGQRLVLIDLSNDAGAFDGANLTFTVKRGPNGDGFANVGFINSFNNDLGVVTVKGDLSRLEAGDATATKPGVKSLNIQSMGRLGLDTQNTAIVGAKIKGELGALVVKGDIVDAFVQSEGAGARIGSVTIGGSLVGNGQVSSGGDIGAVKIGRDVRGHDFFGGGIQATGKLASITIGGSLVGGALDGSNQILSGGDMGPVKIAHDVQGGPGKDSGSIHCGGKLTSVTIGGSLIGGNGQDSGEIFSAGDMGPVKIGHDVLGSSGVQSGTVRANGKLASITVGGSLFGGSNGLSGNIVSSTGMGAVKIGHDVRGGSGDNAGLIESNGKIASVAIGGSLIGGTASGGGEINGQGIGTITIAHDIIGGSATGSASVGASGFIRCDGRLGSITIGGSIISGIDDSTGTVFSNAAIEVQDDIGSLVVKGSLIGNQTAKGFSPVTISARGQVAPGATTDVAIGKITIGGHVEFARILAGYEFGSNVKNADAQIGTVKVGGDWVASQLVAGAMNSATINQKFGDANDAKISGAGTKDTFGIISKIASITIGGRVFGTPNSESTTDHFGFVAEQIIAFKAAGATIPLNPDAHDDNRPIGTTGDTTIHEV